MEKSETPELIAILEDEMTLGCPHCGSRKNFQEVVNSGMAKFCSCDSCQGKFFILYNAHGVHGFTCPIPKLVQHPMLNK